ncbi:MAG TPA: hypothetical protein PLH06_08465 [Candidatus Hydrogenedentes bacterium]|nr:hypothetical protein [Candidatus Hydrogenedentota bacterium]
MRSHAESAGLSLKIRLLLTPAMMLLTVVSMYTTYASLNDSILPEPKVPIPTPLGLWNCSIIALGLSVAIGLMLFAMKLAVIDGHKRLGIAGLAGMTITAFISIVFNMDVLYRTADREFYLRYSADRVRGAYEAFMAEAVAKLEERRVTLMRDIAKQEGELESEIKGLRKAPAGYGQYAKEEDYKLNLLQKTASVDLEQIDRAMEIKKQADDLLRTAAMASLEDIDQVQAQLRVVLKDFAAFSGVPLPPVVKLDSPLFAVFANLFDYRHVGFKEIFFLLIAFFLDLGDIIGYSLLPNRKPKQEPDPENEEPVEWFRREPVVIPPSPVARIEPARPSSRDALPAPRSETDETVSLPVPSPETALDPISQAYASRNRRRHAGLFRLRR